VNKVFEHIGGAAKGSLSGALVYAGIIGLMLTDAVLTPGDIAADMREKSLRDKMSEGTITSGQYQKKASNAFTLYPPAWWALVLGLVYVSKGDYVQKAKFAGILIGSGALAALALNTKKPDILTVRDNMPKSKPVSSTLPFNGPNKKKRMALMSGNKLKFIK